MRSVQEIVTDIVASVGGAYSQSGGRNAVLKAVSKTWAEMYRRLDMGTQDGLPSLRTRASFTITLSGGANTEIPLDGVRRILEIKEAAANGRPRTLAFLSPSDVFTHFDTLDASDGGTYLQGYAIMGQSGATGRWQVYFTPRGAGAHVIEVFYSRAGAEIVDSPLMADRVEVPAEYEEALELGAKFRLYDKKPRQRMEAKQEFEAAMSELTLTINSQDAPEKVVTRSEARILARQQHPRHMGRSGGYTF